MRCVCVLRSSPTRAVGSYVAILSLSQQICVSVNSPRCKILAANLRLQKVKPLAPARTFASEPLDQGKSQPPRTSSRRMRSQGFSDVPRLQPNVFNGRSVAVDAGERSPCVCATVDGSSLCCVWGEGRSRAVGGVHVIPGSRGLTWVRTSCLDIWTAGESMRPRFWIKVQARKECVRGGSWIVVIGREEYLDLPGRPLVQYVQTINHLNRKKSDKPFNYKCLFPTLKGRLYSVPGYRRVQT